MVFSAAARIGLPPAAPMKEVLDQARNILAAIAQGRQFDYHDVEPVIEVLAKLALAN
jgi:hypothetical protein